MIEKQEQLEQLIQEWGFMPFFKNGIEGFSIEEMTPPELLFGDEFMNGPWQWKGPIIANWQAAYGKFFAGKAGYISMEWLPDFMNYRRATHPLKQMDADARHILDVLRENESMLSKQLKVASGFSLSRKRTKFNPDDPTTPIVNRRNGMAFDALIAQLQMGSYVCIADFEYQVSKKGETYGWGVARYCTPEAMYADDLMEAAGYDTSGTEGLLDIKALVDGRTPKQSRTRIVEHIRSLFPEASEKQLSKIV